MKQLSFDFPVISVKSSAFPDVQTYNAVNEMVRQIEEFRRVVVTAVNYNAVLVVSQNDAPTVGDKKMILWEDADATSGQPTHYLMMNDGTTTVSFASEETVP